MKAINILNVVHKTYINELIVRSFITNTQTTGGKVAEAEQLFISIVEENTGDVLSEEEASDLLDDGYYEGETFAVYLTWSIGE